MSKRRDRRGAGGPGGRPVPSGITARGDERLRAALWVGAGLWLMLLVVGFFAPGGWVWGMAGPIGHIENYMISLWLVGLVFAPLLAGRDPLRQTVGIQVYLLAILAIVVSTFRGESMKWIADGPPLAVAAACIGSVVLLHPNRRALLN
jgi:hypothetical protein